MKLSNALKCVSALSLASSAFAADKNIRGKSTLEGDRRLTPDEIKRVLHKGGHKKHATCDLVRDEEGGFNVLDLYFDDDCGYYFEWESKKKENFFSNSGNFASYTDPEGISGHWSMTGSAKSGLAQLSLYFYGLNKEGYSSIQLQGNLHGEGPFDDFDEDRPSPPSKDAGERRMKDSCGPFEYVHWGGFAVTGGTGCFEHASGQSNLDYLYYDGHLSVFNGISSDPYAFYLLGAPPDEKPDETTDEEGAEEDDEEGDDGEEEEEGDDEEGDDEEEEHFAEDGTN